MIFTTAFFAGQYIKQMVAPTVWGPPVWDAFHFIAAGYPIKPTDADVRAYGDFVRLFAQVLPCPPCRKHFAEHLTEIPVDAPLASGRVAFFAWSVAFHNAVNASLNKPALSLEDAVDRYVDVRPVSTAWRVAGRLAPWAIVFALLVALACVAPYSSKRSR